MNKKIFTFFLLLISLQGSFSSLQGENREETSPGITEYPTSSESNPRSFISELLNVLFILGLLVAIMLGVTWALKRVLHTRMHQINITSAIKVLERRTLSPKSAIVLLEIEGKRIVISETPAGITLLAELPISSESTDQKSSFEKIMEKR